MSINSVNDFNSIVNNPNIIDARSNQKDKLPPVSPISLDPFAVLEAPPGTVETVFNVDGVKAGATCISTNALPALIGDVTAVTVAKPIAIPYTAADGTPAFLKLKAGDTIELTYGKGNTWNLDPSEIFSSTPPTNTNLSPMQLASARNRQLKKLVKTNAEINKDVASGSINRKDHTEDLNKAITELQKANEDNHELNSLG